MDDKPFQGKTRYMNYFIFPKVYEEEAAATKPDKKKNEILINS